MSQQINLYNPVFLKRKKYFSANAMLQALLLIAAGSALFYVYAAYQVGLLAKQSEEAGNRHTAEQLKLARYAAEFSPQQASLSLEEELKKEEARAAAQRALIETLKGGAIGNTAGYSEYMRAFARQAISGLWLTGFNIAEDGAQIGMSGAVLSPELLPAYIQRLGGETVMRGKIFASLQMRQPKAEDGKTAHHIEFTLQSAENERVAK
ncbi:MAG: mannose-sensitive agglutinin (MSHA) [Gallionellaceae bacterium]|nr:MAG: mannose-sensitive agglutinin (MSHA) [Gallionellaceae bacterium]